MFDCEDTAGNEVDPAILLTIHVPAKKFGLGRSWNKYERSCCGVLNCSSCTRTCPDLWFFRLPAHCNQRRINWLKQIGRPEIQPSHSLLVCEKHFKPTDILGGPLKKRLKNQVIPTLFLPNTNRRTFVRGKPKHVYQRINNTETKTKDISIEEPNLESLQVNTQIVSNDTSNSSKADVELIKKPSLCNTQRHTLVEFIKSQKPKDTNISYDKFSDQSKIQMFNLYYKNALVYEVLQSTLDLPPVSTIKNILPSTPVGVNEIYMDNLKAQIDNMLLVQKCCTLCLSLTRIKACVGYDSISDTVSGFCGHTNVSPVQYAVFSMVRGITYNWHLIASITLIKSLQTLTEFNTWLDKLLLKLMEIGLNIKAVVTSTDDFFINAFALRYVCVIKPFFIINKKKIYHLFDPLHLMLLLYEELKDNSLSFEWRSTKKIVKWEHISQFCEQDSKRPFRLFNNTSVIDPNDLQQNRLKSAAHILGMSTVTGISIFIEFKLLDKEAKETLDFLIRINKIFAALYPDAIQSEYKNMLTQEDNSWYNHIQFLQGVKWNRAKRKDEAKFITCFNTSMQSIYLMQGEMFLKDHTSSLTQYLNQDPLVEFIHKINLTKFTDTYPDFNEFFEIIKSDLMQNNIQTKERESKSRNIEEFINNTNFIMEKICRKEAKYPKKRSHENHESDYTQMEDCDANSLLYVATYLLDKMYQKYRNSISSRMKIMNSSVYYENKKETFTGSLIIPDNDFLQCVYNMDTVFMNYCIRALASDSLYEELMNKLIKLISAGPIDMGSLKYVFGLFIDLRIYHTMKYNNHIYEMDDRDGKQFVLRKLNAAGLHLENTKSSRYFLYL